MTEDAAASAASVDWRLSAPEAERCPRGKGLPQRQQIDNRVDSAHRDCAMM